MEQKKANVVEEVRAKRLVIVDDEGRERITLDTGFNEPTIYIRNKQGIPILMLSVHDVGADRNLEEISLPSLIMQTDDERTMVQMGVHSGERGGRLPFLELSDKDENLITALLTSSNGMQKRPVVMVMPDGQMIEFLKLGIGTMGNAAIENNVEHARQYNVPVAV